MGRIKTKTARAPAAIRPQAGPPVEAPPKSARDLLQLATEAARRAYAPYSRFRVGAAVLGESGVYLGTNVENASYGLALCAERSALAAAIAAGERRIIAVALAAIDAPPGATDSQRLPCGACRQWLAELAPQAELAALGIERSFTVAELLPLAFALGKSPKQKGNR
jgi:cytidine deaminase